jgi:hypothetical protein
MWRIIMALQHISPEVAVKDLNKSCTSNAMDGADDNMLWDGREDDGNVRSEGKEGEGTDCEDGDSDTDWIR